MREGEHALLVRDLATRVFVWHAGTWTEVTGRGDVGGEFKSDDGSIRGLGDFVRTSGDVHSKETGLKNSYDRLVRLESDLRLRGITEEVLRN